MDECIIEAENASSVFDCVMFYTLSSMPELGLEIGLAEVKCESFSSSFCRLSCTVFYYFSFRNFYLLFCFGNALYYTEGL